MILYKYRKFDEHAIDIIVNNRLYMAKFDQLNDPLDGDFTAPKGTDPNLLKDFRQVADSVRVCSLSKDPSEILLWAHYADNFRGICVEIEIYSDYGNLIPSHKGDFIIQHVEYKDEIAKFKQGEYASIPSLYITKLKNWELEKESRIIGYNDSIYFTDFKIKRILFGQRSPDASQDIILECIKRMGLNIGCEITIIAPTELAVIPYWDLLKGEIITNAASVCSDLKSNKIINSIKAIHRKLRLKDASVSSHTISAQTITKEWQAEVANELIRPEVSVSPHNNEKIDIIDLNESTAYELKVSGKNTHHEFYKDLAKVITYNQYNQSKPLTTFVFISEEKGIDSLQKRVDPKFLSIIKQLHGVDVLLEAI